MRTMTVVAIAMIAATSLAAGQTRPDRLERADRLSTDLANERSALEARFQELLRQLATMPDNAELRRQLAEIEARRHTMSVQLQDQHRLLEEHLAKATQLHADMDPEMAQRMEALAAHQADMAQQSAELRRALELERGELDHDMRRLREEQARAVESLRSAEDELAQEREIQTSLDRLYGDGPRASWAQQDPADSVWRAAREQMNRGQYEAAAALYARIHTQPRYRQSTYRADALYWHAFALNRQGSDDAAREALDLLAQLVREYPADQRSADTNSLMTTVQARLARRGNAQAVRQVRETAASDEARLAYELAVQQAARSADLQSSRAVLATRQGLVSADEARTRALLADAVASQRDGIALSSLPLLYSRSLSDQCARDESEIQLIALSSLVRMDSVSAMPALGEVMARRDECAALLRQSALMIIGRMQTTSAQNMLVEAARNDPDEGVRRTALVYLGNRDPDQAVAIAEQVLSTADDENEGTWALQVLARIDSPRAWTVIRSYAGRANQPAATRRAAIAALSRSDDPSNAAFLRNLYGQVGNDTELKEAILMSAAFRRGGSDAEWLFAIAQDPREEAHRRELAVSALSRTDEVATGRFVALFDGAADKQVKLMIVRVLAQRAKTESIAADKLIAIARAETDIDLRKAAVLGLPGNDPRARDLLLEILRNR